MNFQELKTIGLANPNGEDFSAYGVIQGLKNIRYDYEDSKVFMNRVMPSLVAMRSNAMSDIYKWQVSNHLDTKATYP